MLIRIGVTATHRIDASFRNSCMYYGCGLRLHFSQIRANVAEIIEATASTASVTDFTQVFKLFVTGGQKLINRNMLSTKCSISTPNADGVVPSKAVAQYDGTNTGVYKFDVVLKGTAAGTCLLDVYANGIPAPLYVNATFNDNILEGDRKVLVTVVIYILCLVILVTNTAMNGAYTFVGGMVVVAILVAIVNVNTVKDASVLLSNEMRFYIVLITLVLMLAGFISEFTRKLLCATKQMSFTESRQEMYMRYVKRLLAGNDLAPIYPENDRGHQLSQTKMDVRKVTYAESVMDELGDAKTVLADAKNALKAHRKDKTAQSGASAALEKDEAAANAALEKQQRRMQRARNIDANRAFPNRWQTNPLKQLVVSSQHACLFFCLAPHVHAIWVPHETNATLASSGPSIFQRACLCIANPAASDCA